jgi:hypothetical protein
MRAISRFDLQAVRNARSVTLAEVNNLTYTARLVTKGQHRDVFEVPSKDRSTTYDVIYVHGTHEYLCSCEAGQHDVPCSHCGACIWHDFFRFGRHLPTPAKVA